MKTLAIIAEYNPFHNGHLYQLNTAKEMTGCDFTIALMSGNFLQRGEPSYWNKYTRSSMALMAGIDLVLELPFCYATGSAHDFSFGAVNILNSLNYVDYLCFGAECDNLDLFYQLSEIILNEPSDYSALLKENLKTGYSFAKSRSIAISKYLDKPELSEILEKSNNILALEYICALKKSNSNIKPIIIKRKQAEYNDTKLYDSISSASAIRKAISKNNNSNPELVKDNIPNTTSEKITPSNTFIISANDFEAFIINSIMNKRLNYNNSALKGDFTDYCDINHDINSKLNKLSFPLKYQDIINSLSGKQYTNTRINRALLHLILEYKNEQRSLFFDNGYAFYASILGINKATSSNIREINNSADIPLITKKASFDDCISKINTSKQKCAKIMWGLDLSADRLYSQIVYQKYGIILKNDFNINLPVI